MLIKIDVREKKLIPLLKAMNIDMEYNFDIVIEVLDLGDIIICDDDEKIIIERKSLNDLAASIRDGRYREQSYRLNGYTVHNHNIIYLIEGDIHRYSGKYNKIGASTLQVTKFCLQYYKGFSIMETRDMAETAERILLICKKIQKEKSRENYYKNTATTSDDNVFTNKSYTDVIKKVKKENIKPENIGEIILSQIPGISSKTSKAVMEKFNSLYDLLEKIKDDKHCLDEIYLKQSNGGQRKISQSTVKNIMKYLLYQKNEPVIMVDV